MSRTAILNGEEVEADCSIRGTVGTCPDGHGMLCACGDMLTYWTHVDKGVSCIFERSKSDPWNVSWADHHRALGSTPEASFIGCATGKQRRTDFLIKDACGTRGEYQHSPLQTQNQLDRIADVLCSGGCAMWVYDAGPDGFNFTIPHDLAWRPRQTVRWSSPRAAVRAGVLTYRDEVAFYFAGNAPGPVCRIWSISNNGKWVDVRPEHWTWDDETRAVREEAEAKARLRAWQAERDAARAAEWMRRWSTATTPAPARPLPEPVAVPVAHAVTHPSPTECAEILERLRQEWLVECGIAAAFGLTDAPDHEPIG